MNEGIPFAGDLPNHWGVIQNRFLFYYDGQKVGDAHSKYQLLSLTTGGVKERDINASGGKVPTSYDNYQTVKKGQMVFCLFDLDCSAVFSGISNYNGMITSAYDVFSCSERIINEFSDYWFKYVFSNRYYKMFSKNVRYTITGDMFRSLKTPVPPLAEQQRISGFLLEQETKVDKLIANVQTQIEKLKVYKQSLITEVVTKGLDPTVPMKDSGVEYLGYIPSGWSIISIGQAFIYVGGFAFKSELFTITESNYQVLRIGNVKNDNLILDSKQIFIDESCAVIAKGAEVRADDILFTMTGTKGKRDYFYTVHINDGHVVGKRLFINQRVGLFRKKSNNIKMAFANYLLKEKRILDYIFLSETGTANQGNLGIENIARTKLYLPSLEEQEEICDYLDKKCSQIDRLIAIKQAKIEKLEQYKQSLIYEYVTGKKEVS